MYCFVRLNAVFDIVTTIGTQEIPLMGPGSPVSGKFDMLNEMFHISYETFQNLKDVKVYVLKIKLTTIWIDVILVEPNEYINDIKNILSFYGWCLIFSVINNICFMVYEMRSRFLLISGILSMISPMAELSGCNLFCNSFFPVRMIDLSEDNSHVQRRLSPSTLHIFVKTFLIGKAVTQTQDWDINLIMGVVASSHAFTVFVPNILLILRSTFHSSVVDEVMTKVYQSDDRNLLQPSVSFGNKVVYVNPDYDGNYDCTADPRFVRFQSLSLVGRCGVLPGSRIMLSQALGEEIYENEYMTLRQIDVDCALIGSNSFPTTYLIMKEHQNEKLEGLMNAFNFKRLFVKVKGTIISFYNSIPLFRKLFIGMVEGVIMRNQGSENNVLVKFSLHQHIEYEDFGFVEQKATCRSLFNFAAVVQSKPFNHLLGQQLIANFKD